VQLQGGVIGAILAVRLKYLFLLLNDRMTLMTVVSRIRTNDSSFSYKKGVIIHMPISQLHGVKHTPLFL